MDQRSSRVQTYRNTDIQDNILDKGISKQVCVEPRPSTLSTTHRHRIDKYLDTLLANQPISDGEATDRCQKVTPQDGGLPELRRCRTWSEITNDVTDVCCNVEDLNFSMQNLRPSNIKVIFQRPSCGSPTAVASGFIAGAAPVARHYHHLLLSTCATCQLSINISACRALSSKPAR